MNNRGFTLLEMLVATLIMGIAVVGLLSNISTSLSTASRLTDYDRAALVARHKMDELLLDSRLPRAARIEGRLDPAAANGLTGGWAATISQFEAPPNIRPGVTVLDRVELEIWWMSGPRKRALRLEAYRPFVIPPPGAGA